MDNGGYSACTSPKSYTLAAGSHTFQVRSIDLVGNIDATPAAYTWEIDTAAPTVMIGNPSLNLANSSQSVTYAVTYSGASVITLGAGDVSLIATGTANGTIAVSGTGADSRTVTISGITGYGTLGIRIAANTARDSAGNQAAESGPSTTFIVDNSSGDFDGNGVDVNDALKALRISAGLDSPTAQDRALGDVAPLVNGSPRPDGKIDIGDVIVILRKAVGLVSW